MFWKIEKGWKIELSQAGESPLYLNEQLGIVPENDTSQDRYFVWINLSPGPYLIYLSSTSSFQENLVDGIHSQSLTEGAVAFPVIKGTATYLV